MRTVPEGEVVYGMQLPVQAQSEMFVADWERTSGSDELIAIARKADEAGFWRVLSGRPAAGRHEKRRLAAAGHPPGRHARPDRRDPAPAG